MKLSRTVTYAIKAALQLAHYESQSPIPCSRLAQEGDMPERFLLQILRNLVTHGILKSTRGVDGGYVLKRSPREISILEIIEAIDGPMNNEIAIGQGISEASRDRLAGLLEDIVFDTRQRLESIKLSSLLINPPESTASVKQPSPVAAKRTNLIDTDIHESRPRPTLRLGETHFIPGVQAGT